MDNYKQISEKELCDLFSHNEKSHGDFIRWCKTWGVKISRVDVSRHTTGKRKVTRFAQVAYLCYFSTLSGK